MTLATSLPVPLMLAVPVERQIFDFGTERVGNGGLHRVRAARNAFDYLVISGVDKVRVVAGATDHAVVAEAAIERVETAIAD